MKMIKRTRSHEETKDGKQNFKEEKKKEIKSKI